MSEQNKALVDRARALLAAATPGPWGTGDHVGEPRALCVPPGGMESLLRLDRDGMAICTSAADAALIAAAPELLKALCDAVADAERRAKEAEAGAAAWNMRPFVLAFALKMEAKLKSHDVQRGSRGWWSAAPRDLFAYLIAEVDELEATLEHGMEMNTVDEAVDVANFAMMIADVSGMDSYSVASALPGRAVLDRLAAAESERDALRARKADICDCARPYAAEHCGCNLGWFEIVTAPNCPKCSGSGAVIVDPSEAP